MDKKLWFRAKKYGWGWYPATWQGWLVLGFYAVFVVGMYFTIESLVSSPSLAVTIFLPLDILATLVLMLVCWKTGEKPKWRWGKSK